MHITEEAADLIPGLAAHLRLSMETQQRALNLLHRLNHRDVRLHGKPKNIAAAAIYMSGILNGEHVSQPRCAAAAQCAVITIYQRCRDLSTQLERLHASKPQ